MSWINDALLWYLFIGLIGIFFFPISRILLPKFFDAGYPFAKSIGILAITYSIFVLSTLHILPFTQVSLLIVIFFLIAGIIVLVKKFPLTPLSKDQIIFIILEEVAFLAAFIFWVIIRGQEPSIHSLEKYMDFGFMQSIGRTTYFPPLDMWLSGHTINYYYFGHMTGAVLTKLSSIPLFKTYNLILATLFGLGVTQVFSICFNLAHMLVNNRKKLAVLTGILGSFIINLGGNLHTIYLFTTGYQNDKPIPFWQILGPFNPEKYWYPNATRFIPFTIHEFPIYSYVVADLHGHVFDIPFVLLTLTLLIHFVMSLIPKKSKEKTATYQYLFYPAVIGFMCGIHYMTNAWDFLIYGMLSVMIFFIFLGNVKKAILSSITLLVIYYITSLPFTLFLHPPISGIGVNCAPAFLTAMHKIGPFLFEAGNCQVSKPWMLFILWGFFLINFLFFLYIFKRVYTTLSVGKKSLFTFIFCLFTFSVFLLLIPEFFYFKDIYPQHFRANTMFKLGYQAFIMMGIASSFTFYIYKTFQEKVKKMFFVYILVFFVIFSLVSAYPSFAITSYYGKLDQPVQIDGINWIKNSYPGYWETINYLNANVEGQPTILEAQGDSYTDYDLVSAFTGLPTVAGWWVHEWLWRGSSQVVADLIPDIQSIYQNPDITITKNLISKYKIHYIIVGSLEKEKYTQIDTLKFSQIGKIFFTSRDQSVTVYDVAQ